MNDPSLSFDRQVKLEFEDVEEFNPNPRLSFDRRAEPCVIICSKTGCKIIHTGRPEMVRPEGDGYVSDEH